MSVNVLSETALPLIMCHPMRTIQTFLPNPQESSAYRSLEITCLVHKQTYCKVGVLGDNMFVTCRHTLVVVSVGYIELRAEPHEVASLRNSV